MPYSRDVLVGLPFHRFLSSKAIIIACPDWDIRVIRETAPCHRFRLAA
jgi:hypothetical protein